MNITTLATATRALAFVCFALAASRASAQACGTIQDLGNLGQGTYEATAMSADGEVIIGYYYLGGNVRLAFRWTEATGMQDISMPWGDTWATAISSDGSTIVGYGKNYLNLDRAFRWTESAGRQDLGTLGGSSANALAVSADGSVIVGYAANFDGQSHAFRWTSATGMQDLGTLGGYESRAIGVSADGSVIVGWSFDSAQHQRLFRWTAEAGMQDLGGQDQVSAQCIPMRMSEDGTAIVGYLAQSFWYTAFRWTNETSIQELGTLGGVESVACDVSADGRVVSGYSRDDRTRPWGFLWTPEGGMEAFAGPLGAETIHEAVEISSDGQVAVGFGSSMYSPWGFRWTSRGGALKLIGQDWESRTANAVSSNGDVIVGKATHWWGGPETAFRWIKNPADVNGDGFLNADDFDQFAVAFENGDPSGDFNHDGFVNGDDYDGFAEAFEAGC